MLINKPIPSLVGGVSQQPENLRHPTQVTSMLNCNPRVADGLSKRAGSDNVALLSTANHTDSYGFGINRGTAGTSERYTVVISNGDIKVFNWDGVEQTVNKPDGTAYLGATVPRTSFGHVTVADYTFITNKLVGVSKTNLDATVPVPTVYVVVKLGVVDSDYKVTLNGTTFTATIGNTPGANKTETIAEALKVLINAGGLFTATRQGNLLVIVKNDSAGFTWSVTDTYGDQAMFAFRDKVQRFEELPRKFVENVTIQVAGSPDTPNDGWYVKWQKSDANHDGVWVETRANGIYTELADYSMPHVLVREVDTTWTFRRAVWQARTVGNDESAPMPSFVGHTIQAIFVFRGRLGFLSDENAILSQADGYFKFFPDSARVVADSDPIDVSAGSTSAKINFLRSCAPFDKALFITSDSQQFQFGGQDILSPRTARLAPTTAFEASPCAPAVIGSNVLFPTLRGAYTSVREYYFDPDSAGNDALDVTAHVPSFVPGSVFQMTAIPTLDQLFILTGIRSECAVYNSYWNGQEKVQSAWHRWGFAGNPTIVSLIPFNTTMVALLQYTQGLFMVRLELDGRPITDAPLTWPVRLDRKFTTGAGVYNPSGTGSTSWTVPYNIIGAMQAVVLNKTGEVGQVLDLETVGVNTVMHSGNYEGYNVVIGEKFTAAVILSKFFVRDRDDKPILNGRLNLRELTFNFTQTGYFEVAVFPNGRPSYTYPYSGRVLGVSGITLGTRQMQNGEFKCPIGAKSDEVSIVIQSDEATPFNVQAGQYAGWFAQQSRRA